MYKHLMKPTPITTLQMLNRLLSAFTFARFSIWLQTVSPGAGAQVAAFCVFTQEVTRLRRQRALIHV